MDSNSTHVCRLCLESSDVDLRNVFDKFQDSTIASILAKHFWFQVDKNDGLPQWVCEICWIQTKTFHHFYKRLEFRYMNYLSLINLASIVEIKQERSISPTEEALEADLNLVDETDLALEADDTPTIDNENSSDGDSDDNSCDQNETEQTSENEDKPYLEKPKNEDATVNQPQTLHIERPDRIEIEKQNAQIRKFFRMQCEMCSDVEFDSIKEARKHYAQVHKTKGFLVCCGTKFKYRYRMLDHIRYHVNPDVHRCDQCSKSFKDRQALKNHVKCHEPLNLRDHKCSLCSNSYTRAAALKYHVQHKHDTCKKVACDQCGKICQSNQLLASHKKNVHDFSLELVCEACGRRFKQKSTLLKHKEVVHSTKPPPKAQCDICGVWLKHGRYLQKHLKLHLETQNGNADVVNCTICNKKVKNKRLLAVHVRFSHSERCHRCTFCDKAFKTPKNLKEHIAIHTGEDLYGCSYCDKTFKSNANMYAHRKKAHLVEWTRDRANTTIERNKSDQGESREVSQ